MPANHVIQGRASAAIRDQIGLQTQLGREQQTSHVRGRANAAMRLFHAVAILFQVGDKFLEILRRKVFPRDDHCRRVCGQPDWLKILRRVVFQICVKCRGRHMGPHAGGKQRVAIVFRPRRTRCADRSTGAADVFDHDVLAEHSAHSVGHDPRDHIAWAAGRIGNDHRDRACRVILRSGRQASHHQRGNAEKGLESCLHELLHIAFTRRLEPRFPLLVGPFP